ncbi:MAG: Fe-S cluster assembly ATPase SufC [Patescibacteria group bacterium]
MGRPLLAIKNITVVADKKEVVKDFSLIIRAGETHFLLGPNGSGKTSLCWAILGHPNYRITRGDILWKGKSVLALTTEQRARLGIFLSFQEPPGIAGVSVGSFLQTTARALGGKTVQWEPKHAQTVMRRLGMPNSLLERSLNEGFSGGEKKKGEMLQLAAARPQCALLDEIDAGIDIDSLKSIATILRAATKKGMGMLFITHTLRAARALRPDAVHIIKDGRMVASGTTAILKKLERGGFTQFI